MTRTREEYQRWQDSLPDWYSGSDLSEFRVITYEEWIKRWADLEVAEAEKVRSRQEILNQPCDPDCGCMDCHLTLIYEMEKKHNLPLDTLASASIPALNKLNTGKMPEIIDHKDGLYTIKCPGLSDMIVNKAGLDAFDKALKEELGQYGVE